MTERDDIENLFSSAFDGAEMLPPPAVKEAIDSALFSAEAGVGRKKAWMWWSTLLLVLVGGTSYWMFATSNPQTNQATGTNQNDSISSSENGTSAQLNQETGENSSITSNSESGVYNDENSTNEKQNNDSKRTANATNAGGLGVDKARFADLDTPNPLVAAGGGDRGLSTGDGGLGLPEGDKKESGQTGGDQANGINEVSQKSNEHGNGSSEFGNGSSETKIGVDALATEPSSQLPIADAEWISGSPSVLPKSIKSNPWSLAAYAGTAFGFNTLRGSSDMKIKEQAGVYGSLEALYSLTPKLSISGGFDFAQRKDRLILNTTINDSVFVGNNVVYVYDTGQVVIDTLYYPIYEQTTNVQENVGYVRYYSIGIPLYVHYHMEIASRFSLDAAVGVRFSYQKYRNEEIAPNILYPDVYKQFGVNISFRPEFTYQMNRLGIGIYARFEYDILNGMKWDALSRTRWSTGLGLCVRYKL